MNISFGHFSLRNDDFEHFFTFAFKCNSIGAAAAAALHDFTSFGARMDWMEESSE